MTLGSKAPRRKSRKAQLKRLLLVVFPLLLLSLELVVYPIFFETRDASSDFSGAQLVRAGSASLGTFKAHRIYVSLDDIGDPNYLSFATKSPEDDHACWSRGHRVGNTLAISIVDMGNGWGGNLLSRVLHKLESLSSGDRDRIIDLLQQARSSPNDVLWYDFRDIATTNRQSFPIDHLLLLKLDEQKKETYPKRMRELLDLAGQERLSSLVLPCLGRNPEAKSKDWLSCTDTYAALFEDLKLGQSPRGIYLSFYKRWSDPTITQEAGSLGAAWKSALANEEQKSGVLPVIYQADLRLMLLFLSVCLLVCSLRIELSFKNVVIVCFSFVPAALGLQDKVAPLLSEVVQSSPAWVIKCLLLAILSTGYLFFAGLDVDGFVKSLGKKNAP